MRTVRLTHLLLGWLAIFAAGQSLLHAGDVLTTAERIAARHLSYVYGSGDMQRGGLDCSGFVRTVFRQACGIDLPDEAGKQLAYCREHGQVWDAASNWTPQVLQPGDLIFYAVPELSPRESMISHVMIYCGNGIAVGAQGAGRQLDGSLAGVGYYPFRVRAPQGFMGEPGLRFLRHREVFAYGRLVPPSSVAVNPSLVSIQATAAPGLSNPDFD